MEREILDILFPKVRAELLRLLFTAPTRQRYVRELTRMSGFALRTVQEELNSLAAARLVTSWSNGYYLFYQANRNHPMFLNLLGIVQTNGRLPRVKNFPTRRRRRIRKRQTQPFRERLDRGVNWNLFSQ